MILQRVAQHYFNLGCNLVCNLMASQQLPFECFHKIIYQFSFLWKSDFTCQFVQLFFGSVILMADILPVINVGLVFLCIGSVLVKGQIIATHSCARCTSLYEQIRNDIKSHCETFRLRVQQFFDIFTHVFYPFIFLCLLYVEYSHVMSLHIAFY